MQYDLSYYLAHYRRRIITGVILAFVVITGVIIFAQVQTARERQGTIAVPVEVVPRDATVKLSDGQQLPNRGAAYIKPGDHKVIVSKEGFTTRTYNLRVSENSVPYIYIGLAGKTKEAKDWQKNHARDYQNLELLTVEKNRDYTTLLRSANPIVEILPIKDPYYTIDYRNGDNDSIELSIFGTSPRYREIALEYLRSKGYDPTDYRITYEGFENPLVEEATDE